MDNQQKERQMDLVRREMERKSLDTFRVYNPLDIPFRFMYNSYWHTVPAKGTKDFPRYLCVHYFKKISEFMIGQMAIQKGSELLERRLKGGLPEFLNKYDENKAIWDNTQRVHDPELMKEIGNIVILGLVEEYGKEIEPKELQKPVKLDLRPIQDQIMDSFNNKTVPSEIETSWINVKPVDSTGEVLSIDPQNANNSTYRFTNNQASNTLTQNLDKEITDKEDTKNETMGFGERMKIARANARKRREDAAKKLAESMKDKNE